MGKTVAIVQSNYIPWKGYFDLISWADEFVLFDDMQYTKRDWRNRNKIKTANGAAWLTIPVLVKGKYYQRIDETEVVDSGWVREHWNAIRHNYARARYFATYKERLEELYLGCGERLLSRINFRFLTAVCELLGIRTRISWSTDYSSCEGKTERLVHLCRQAGAAEYLSGPSASDYIDPALFDAAGIRLRYADYTGYPEYAQLFPPFDHYVSVLDLILNEGPDASRFLLSTAATTPGGT